jgi:hypothetical protein
MAVLQSLLGSIASAAELDGYAAIVDALPGGPPMAHWRLGEVAGSQIRDRKGVRHGTYLGTVGYGAPALPQNSGNGAINFAGTGSGEVPHDAGLLLSGFTLTLWFRLNSLPAEPGIYVLFSKDGSGAVAGDFAAFVNDAGLSLGFQTGVGGTREVLPNTPDLETNQTYYLAVRADNTGFDAYLNGQYLGKNTTFGSAWAANTQTIVFSGAPWRPETADCVLDEVALYSRVLTETEILALGQKSAAPVAVDDTASVPESATTAIDVLATDAYVGASPILSIIAQPSGGDSVAVDGTVIEYTAGAVAANTNRSFQYRVTDALGTSNTAVVTVTVKDSGFAPLSNANCFLETGTDTVVIGSGSGNIGTALANAVAAAPPGRNILIAAGTYTGGTVNLSGSGTAANPIVIRPQSGIGTVTINSPVWTLPAGSSRLVISKLHFNNPSIRINGSHHRVTRCRLRQINSHSFTILAATDTRIDHCDVSDIVSNTTTKSFVRLNHTTTGSGALQRVLVDYNYCHDSNPAAGVNGSDFIGLSSSSGGAAEADPELVIDHNLFENINITGDAELLGAKCSGIVFRFNTLLNTGNECYLNAPRQGLGFECRSNWFEGCVNNSPLHVWHDDGLVIGNRFIGGLNFWVAAGTKYGGITAPVVEGYGASRDGRIIGNRMGSGRIQVGGYWSGDPTVPALNNNLHGNTRDAGGDAHQLIAGRHSGTTFNADNEPFVAAVKLAASDVGLAAPDPLCPSGPQS